MKTEEYTQELNPQEDYEEISQVPLETDRPVGTSHVGTGPEGMRSRRRDGKRAGVRRERQEYPGRQEKDFRQQRRRRTASRGVPAVAVFMALVIGFFTGFGGGYYLWGWTRPNTVDLKAVEVPSWVKQDFLRKNIFSRPDVTRSEVNNIVIHYVANPGSTAEGNRNYFDSLADQDAQAGGTSSSSHFIVGLEGEVIQCVPLDEIAYANAPRNNDTVSIEVCHPDDTGKYNDASYESVVRLSAWLCKELSLKPEDLLRHYDISGKQCPKYYVEHEDAWKQLKKDVGAAMKEKQ